MKLRQNGTGFWWLDWPKQWTDWTSNIERPTSNVEYWWRYALSILKQANRSLRRALRSWAQNWKTQGRTTPFGKLRAWACRKQPNRISKSRFALGLRSQSGEVVLLSVFFKIDRSTLPWDPEALDGQNTLFDVGRSMFDVRCSFFS